MSFQQQVVALAFGMFFAGVLIGMVYSLFKSSQEKRDDFPHKGKVSILDGKTREQRIA